MSRYDYSNKKRRGLLLRRAVTVIILAAVLALLIWGGSSAVKMIREKDEEAPPTHTQEVVPGEVQQGEQALPGEDDPQQDEPPAPPTSSSTDPTAPGQENDPEQKDPEQDMPSTALSNPGSDDWRTILVSAAYPLAEELDMERTTIGWPVDSRIAPELQAFLDAAKAEGHTLQVISGYRTFARSAELLEREIQNRMKYNGISREEAEVIAAQWVAPPGTSEHNTGLAVDIISIDYYSHHPDLEPSFENDPEAIWMKENCARFGFILRYPKGKTDITGIGFEPWHFRYVGVENATYIMENELTLEEFLGVA